MKFALSKLPVSYMQRGRAYEKLGQKTLAMADYKTAVELDASNPTQREARIEARERLGVLEGEMLTAQQPAQAQPLPHIDPGRRIALVIGVGAYQNAPKLRNPPNDAAAMAGKLRDLGFAEVIEVADPTARSSKPPSWRSATKRGRRLGRGVLCGPRHAGRWAQFPDPDRREARNRPPRGFRDGRRSTASSIV